jgi:hypothetical protein
MAFKARKMKKGLFEVLGLEQYIDRRVAELKKALSPKVKAAKKVVRKLKPARAMKVKGVAPKPTALDLVIKSLEASSKRAALIKAGRQKDQLLRSLIPLYLARNSNVEITSGVVSKFWKLHGVKYAAPNAAKALREHVGYARQTKTGRQITPNGIKYVEQAVMMKKAA